MKSSYLVIAWILLIAFVSCKKETTPVNGLPQIDSIALDPTVTKPGGTINITVFASDPDSDLLIYHYTTGAGTIMGSGSSVTWQAPDYTGEFHVGIYVSDGKDSVITTQLLPVSNSNDPVITGIAANPDTVEAGGSTLITVNAYDADGDPLTYEYVASGGAISGTGSSVTWTAPPAGGNFSIQVNVSDGYGGIATGEVTVTVNYATPPANMVAHWLFNGDAQDVTGNGNHGIPTSGHAYFGGGPAPQLTSDRFGNIAYCYHFDQGANIEVPYSSSLNPQSMTISMWIKMEEQPNNDYIISLDHWNGWKLSLNDLDYLFFTVKTVEEYDTTIYDRDSNPVAVNPGTWTHIAVSFEDGFMNFYFNGELVRQWNDIYGKAVPEDNINLTIGSDLPTGVYSTNPGDFYVGWGGYFKGDIDDVRFYSSALTPPQVTAIYNYEKDHVIEE